MRTVIAVCHRVAHPADRAFSSSFDIFLLLGCRKKERLSKRKASVLYPERASPKSLSLPSHLNKA